MYSKYLLYIFTLLSLFFIFIIVTEKSNNLCRSCDENHYLTKRFLPKEKKKTVYVIIMPLFISKKNSEALINYS